MLDNAFRERIRLLATREQVQIGTFRHLIKLVDEALQACRAYGPLPAMPCLVECPQLAKADIECGQAKSESDPQRP
jgi:hypothetical protein